MTYREMQDSDTIHELAGVEAASLIQMVGVGKLVVEQFRDKPMEPGRRINLVFTNTNMAFHVARDDQGAFYVKAWLGKGATEFGLDLAKHYASTAHEKWYTETDLSQQP